MAAGPLLRAPRLRSDAGEGEERSASWLELFFDLVFVIAVTQLGVVLAGDLTPGGFLRFGLLFVPVWWAWVGYTNYADRFDSDDLVFRLLFLAAMLAMAAVAVAIPDVFDRGSAIFAGAYAAVRAILVALYGRARRSVPAARSLCNVTMGVFTVGTVLWLASLLLPDPWRFALWGAALVIEGATPWLARRAMASVPYHVSHLPERYGLFTLIVLGESLVAIAVGIRDARWQPASVLVAVLGFVCVGGLWWLYFDAIERGAIRRSLLARNAFIYAHLFVAAGLAMAGVGVRSVILAAGSGHGALSPGAAWTLDGGIAAFLAALVVLRVAAGHGAGERPLLARTAAVAALALLALLGPSLGPPLAVGLLALTLSGLVAVDAGSRRASIE